MEHCGNQEGVFEGAMGEDERSKVLRGSGRVCARLAAGIHLVRLNWGVARKVQNTRSRACATTVNQDCLVLLFMLNRREVSKLMPPRKRGRSGEKDLAVTTLVKAVS